MTPCCNLGERRGTTLPEQGLYRSRFLPWGRLHPFGEVIPPGGSPTHQGIPVAPRIGVARADVPIQLDGRGDTSSPAPARYAPPRPADEINGALPRIGSPEWYEATANRQYGHVSTGQDLPESVVAAYARATRTGFQLACEVEVGRLLATLSTAVPEGGRILEIGTGVGVGLAWLVHGLGERHDIEVVTVELDDGVQKTTRSASWPPWVHFKSGDGAEVVGGLGAFDLIFPDAPGGKIFKLDRTVAALRPGGVLIVDDMDLTRHEDEELRAALTVVRQRLLEDAELVCAELGYSSGVIVAVKRRA